MYMDANLILHLWEPTLGLLPETHIHVALKRRDSPRFSVFLERLECDVRDEAGFSVRSGLFLLYQMACRIFHLHLR
jgi:hypothetical protein